LRKFPLNLINSKLALTSWFFNTYHQEPVIVPTDVSERQFKIRAATPADLNGVAQIITESFHSQQGIWGWAFPLLRLGIYEDLKHRLASPAPHHICLVAADTTKDEANNLLGTVELGIRFSHSWTQGARSFPYLSNLAVSPQYRRHGVASGLLKNCEKVSQEWGFQDLYLHVLENNHQARQLYCKLGYRVHKVESNWNLLLPKSPNQILLHKPLSNDGSR
jgi:ribosomal protein S18 acetylase RimI-like enzyme